MILQEFQKKQPNTVLMKINNNKNFFYLYLKLIILVFKGKSFFWISITVVLNYCRSSDNTLLICI